MCVCVCVCVCVCKRMLKKKQRNNPNLMNLLGKSTLNVSFIGTFLRIFHSVFLK